MFTAIHTLQLKVFKDFDKDEFDRPIPGTGGEYWQEIGKCRCDDNTTKEFISENGAVYRPSYHVVCSGKVSVKAGDIIRCMDGETVRGEGKVYSVKTLNLLNYSEVWL